MTSPAAIGIVVPTWNRAAATVAAVGSLARLAHAPRFTIVVDNGSRAAERAAVAAALAGRADVSLKTLPENRGFAGAVNVGLAEAFGRGAAAVLVLNDDAEVEPTLLTDLTAVMRSDPRAGIVAPRIVDSASGAEVSRGERGKTAGKAAEALVPHLARRRDHHVEAGGARAQAIVDLFVVREEALLETADALVADPGDQEGDADDAANGIGRRATATDA